MSADHPERWRPIKYSPSQTLVMQLNEYDDNRGGHHECGKRSQEDERFCHLQTLPVTAAATASTTPSVDNPPTTETSHRTSRSSFHNVVGMTHLHIPAQEANRHPARRTSVIWSTPHF
jgi:hypothetical protein